MVIMRSNLKCVLTLLALPRLASAKVVIFACENEKCRLAFLGE